MQVELTTEDRERFEQYVDRSGGPDACHLWTGARNEKGYGWFWLNGRARRAHRVAWCLAGYEITKGKPHVLHDCPGGDDPACVNPDHLRAGTNAENLRDMSAKGRGRQSKKGLPYGVQRRRGGRFTANSWDGSKTLWLGTYDTPEEAHAVAVQAKEELLFGPDRQEEG